MDLTPLDNEFVVGSWRHLSVLMEGWYPCFSEAEKVLRKQTKRSWASAQKSAERHAEVWLMGCHCLVLLDRQIDRH